jgi:hypothetical protein
VPKGSKGGHVATRPAFRLTLAEFGYVDADGEPHWFDVYTSTNNADQLYLKGISEDASAYTERVEALQTEVEAIAERNKAHKAAGELLEAAPKVPDAPDTVRRWRHHMLSRIIGRSSITHYAEPVFEPDAEGRQVPRLDQTTGDQVVEITLIPFKPHQVNYWDYIPDELRELLVDWYSVQRKHRTERINTEDFIKRSGLHSFGVAGTTSD